MFYNPTKIFNMEKEEGEKIKKMMKLIPDDFPVILEDLKKIFSQDEL
jgi:hypothetical protein